MKVRQKELFNIIIIFFVGGGALILGVWGVVEWDRKSYLGPAKIESLLRLKSRSARGASRHPAFMDLVLIKGIRKRGESKISFCYPRSVSASPQTYRERGGVIWCMWSICRWLSQWWLVFVLLGIDATLVDGCGVWEYLQSLSELKWGRRVSPRFHLLVLCLV